MNYLDPSTWASVWWTLNVRPIVRVTGQLSTVRDETLKKSQGIFHCILLNCKLPFYSKRDENLTIS